MASPFKQKIRKSLDNPSLQAALDDNATRRRAARLAAYRSLPEDPDILRQRAHAVRQEVIANLDVYLEQFSQNAHENGFTIHRARDAKEAVRQVLEIVKETGGKRIVKSKTMVGEELEVNEALEAAGCDVVETDLGEWIVQLRGEKPAHLLTPAVHLNRKDVAQLCTDRFNVPYTEDVTELTAFARKILRSAFLEADVGISGVNFGVISEGSICLVTNEGNGRMVTTLPPVHIALMGCERMVRDLDDLALLLSLLPRASAGQKISVYTSLIRSPRKPGEADGAQQRHIILIDNGRTAMRGSPLNDALLCIRCGSCLNACPVFREIGGHAYVGKTGKATPYSGPIGSVISAGLFDVAEFSNLARASSLCGACQDACPVDIPLPDLLLRVRAGLNSGAGRQPTDRVMTADPQPQDVPQGLKWGLRFYSWLAESPSRFNAAQKSGAWLARLVFPRSEWMKMPAISGWGASRDLPRPARQSFQTRWKELHPSQKAGGELPPQENSSVESPIVPGKTESPVDKESRTQLIDKFRTELETIGGRFEYCRADEVHSRLLTLLREYGCDRILAWDTGELPPGISEVLLNEGIEICQPHGSPSSSSSRPNSFPDPTIKVGLTGALAAVAETGTIVLDGGKGRPSTPSLLPEIHLAIIQVDQIYKRLEQVFDLEAAKSCTNLVLVSGPSRTADIEMTLTIGVHGPGVVVVLCVEPVRE